MRIRPSAVRVLVISSVLLVFLSLTAYGQVGAAFQKVTPKSGPIDIGIIFNSPNLLLGLESYQAGIGLKLGLPRADLRGMVDFVYNGGASSFALQTGLAAEFHQTPEPVSFYWGGVVGAGFMTQSGGLVRVPLSAGLIAGVEVFPFPFVSFFVEYGLEAGATISWASPGATPTVDILADIGMGNDARIGIVLYFQRAAAKK